jgi:D-alanyl-lipoteichoic acid acyltransferase DltB (MBOAT superfamily)
MQFSDPLFLFAFLPLTLIVYYVCGFWSRALAAAVLTIASLYFFSFAGYDALGVLAGSIAFNYAVGVWLLRAFRGSKGERPDAQPPSKGDDRRDATSDTQRAASGRLVLLWVGVVANLALLGYFKYRGFFLENVAAVLGRHSSTTEIWVPLGVSFYTFQKIAFLVDAYRGKFKECGPLEFALFSTFFPLITSGPITRAQEMLPQFAALSARFNAQSFTEGLSMFVVGLAKKVLIADTMGTIADPSFASFDHAHGFGAAQAWVGVLAYAMQIYYDFSGYSEMALGLAKMFRLKLPCNFNAPYKANSMIGFWARWHMSLSRWLRDYVFLSLTTPFHAGKRILGMFVTMVICGLWHGAQWTFVVWGALHGTFLAVNHAWRELVDRFPDQTARFTSKPMRPIGRLITFAVVTMAWVFFRAPNLAVSWRVLEAMAGRGKVAHMAGFTPYPAALVLGVLAYTFLGPDTIAIFSGADPCVEKMPTSKTRLRWSTGWPSAIVIAVLVFLIVRSHMIAPESIRFTYSNF